MNTTIFADTTIGASDDTLYWIYGSCATAFLGLITNTLTFIYLVNQEQ